MYSFYGGKQGRTYNIVERYDQIYIDQNDRRPEKPDGKLIDFEPDTWYDFGEYLFYQGSVYLVLYQTENVQDKIDINNLKIKLNLDDLNNTDYVARIKGMVNEFQKGGAYTDANYGQYVIIDTILNQNHKNDDINGIIYRRGFDYTEVVNSNNRPHKDDKATRTFSESGNVEFQNLYVYHDYEVKHNGTDIQGNDIWNVIDKGFNTNRWVAAWRKYILKPGGGAIYVGQIVGPQGDSPEIIGLSWSEFLNKESTAGTEDYYKNIEMEPTPGWSAQDGYNDYIRTGYCNIKDQDGNVTGAYLSFNIPSTIFKFSAQSVSPYGESRSHYDEASRQTDNDISFTASQDSRTGEWKYTNLINQHSYTGATGQNAKHPFYYNFDIAIPKGIHGQDIESMKIEKGSDIKDNLPMGIEVVDDDEYITYYTKNYNNSFEGNTSEPQGIWPYRVINEILPISKTRNEFRPDNIANIGDLYSPSFNSEESESNIMAICIEAGETGSEIEFKNNYNQYSNDIGHRFYSKTSQWQIVKIPKTAAAAKLKVDYTAGNSEEKSVRLLDYLIVDNLGNLYASYSDMNQLYYLTTIGSVENITLLNEEDITNRQYWGVKYQGNNNTTEASGFLNRLLAIDRQGDNIIALYSDPKFRNDIKDSGRENIDYYFKEWTDPIKGTYYENLLWVNLGSTDGTYHILGTTTYDKLDINSNDSTYKNGLEGSHAGWVVTVFDNNENKYKFFAYDYENNTPTGTYIIGDNIRSNWYQVSSLADEVINPEKIILLSEEGNNRKPLKSDTLKNNGFWFVISNGHEHNIN